MKFILYPLAIMGLWKIYDLVCLYLAICAMRGGI